MNSGVRVIKQNRAAVLQVDSLDTTARPSEREIANAVKTWIAELAQRRYANERSAYAFKLRSMKG